MTTVELKKVLTRRITEINDISFLKAIKTILDSKINKEIISLSANQRDEIIKSKKEIEEGLCVEQEFLDKEVSKWANEK